MLPLVLAGEAQALDKVQNRTYNWATVDKRQPTNDEIPLGKTLNGKLPPLSKQTLRDQIVHRIEEAISTGRLKPGDRLVEQDLAEELNTSRAPIREAIRELIDRGLLASSPRRGTYVAEWSPQSITEAYLLRGALEEIAFRLAVYKASDADLQRLEEIVERMKRAADRDNIAEVAMEDIAFHRSIIEMTKQHHLLRVWSSIGVEAVIVFSSQKTDPTLVPLGHQEMLDALKKRDADLAIEHNWRGIWQGLTNDISISAEALREQLGPELAQRFLNIVQSETSQEWLGQKQNDTIA